MTFSIDQSLPLGTLAGETGRVLIIGGLFLAIFLLAELWRYLGKPPVEWTRKFVHLSCGLIIACFHWLFASPWSVLALGIGFAAVMLLARRFKWFQSVYGVKRTSNGDIYYLISVFLLFSMSSQRPIIYFIAILTLTIADALAAVLGSTYQRISYAVEDQRKSLEGSTVFFMCTFLIVQLPLLLLTDIDRLQCVLISLQIALVVTCLEAICLNGIDNLIVPIATYFFIIKLLPIPSSAIALQFIVQLILLSLIHFISWRFKFLAVSGAIGSQLFLYGAYTLGGPTWIIIPLLALGIFLIIFSIFNPFVKQKVQKIYQVLSVFYILAVPILVIFCYNFFKTFLHITTLFNNKDFFYVFFIAVIAAQLAIGVYRLCWLYSKRIKLNWLSISAFSLGSYLLLIPFGLWVQTGKMDFDDCFLRSLNCFYRPRFLLFGL